MLEAISDAGTRADRSAMKASDPTAEGALQARLVLALRDGGVLDANRERVRVLETHISYVLLTGQFAYKIKKAVDLGFLDFTTLAARRFYCEEELRLNRRLAPTLYLDVVAISGNLETPTIGGDGAVLEYAVKMREFPQDALASRELARGELSAVDIDALAATVAAFHRSVGVASIIGSFGVPDDVLRIALQNVTQIRPLLNSAPESAALDAVGAWTEREYAACARAMARRRAEGFVRECHGDLHLGNIARVDGELTIFDCIEFNEKMRWIDVMSEVAFTTMDLHDRGRPDLAHRFLNAYLEITGDYDGLSVLRFYVVYRAMVRAKIARLRAAQLGVGDARNAALAEYDGYLGLAQRCTRPPQPAIVLTHGLSGCGKTTLSQALLEMTGAVRIRTDVERKRMLGAATARRDASAIEGGLYTPQTTERTYATVLALARGVAGAGYVAIVDAASLMRWQRELFRKLAAELRLPLIIVAFAADEATLRQRIANRQRTGNDASDADLAVLEYQLRTQETLGSDELANTVAYDAEAPLAEARSPARWQEVLHRLAPTNSALGIAPAVAQPAAAPGLAAKIAFLSRPESYPEPTTLVEPVETHMSWVFLTDRFAYKLKKPVRLSYLDFSTEALRRQHCSEEVRLNRRLSDGVYLGTVPLMTDAGAGLRLGAGAAVIDWLVKMRRLPANRMLDRMIRNRVYTDDDVRRVVARLSRFYRATLPVTLTPASYRAGFAAGIAENLRELCAPGYALPVESIEPTCALQQSMLERQPALFDRRVDAGRIIEAHGDLRPEHICLEREPQVIDCLEFSCDFRILDAADELAFLALECERLGAPELRQVIFATYVEVTGDQPPDPLLHFYQSYRACVRARIAIWHLNDAEVRDPRQWVAQATHYLRLARDHLVPENDAA